MSAAFVASVGIAERLLGPVFPATFGALWRSAEPPRCAMLCFALLCRTAISWVGGGGSCSMWGYLCLGCTRLCFVCVPICMPSCRPASTAAAVCANHTRVAPAGAHVLHRSPVCHPGGAGGICQGAVHTAASPCHSQSFVCACVRQHVSAFGWGVTRPVLQGGVVWWCVMFSQQRAARRVIWFLQQAREALHMLLLRFLCSSGSSRGLWLGLGCECMGMACGLGCNPGWRLPRWLAG